MSKHRRTRHHRKIAIAALAIGAVGVPSVAMACWGDQGNEDRRSQDRWERTSDEHRGYEHRADKGERHQRPASRAAQAPTSKPSATAKPRATSKPSTAPAKPRATTKPSTATKPSAPAAKPSATAAQTAAPASTDTARVVELVNKERSKVGCSPLTVNAKLTKAAQDHSKDMAAHRNMSHTGSDGSSPEDRIQRAGYNWSAYGENVAYGYSTPESVMAGWMSSPGHKRNILDCSFKEIGVGLAQPGDYWTQDFGTAG